MKPNELAAWMKQHQKSALFVADTTKVNVRTVERFLAGETKPHRIVLQAFRDLMMGFDAAELARDAGPGPAGDPDVPDSPETGE